ncbi:MAG: tetratricopeptide repeat protein, partial [Candidatus Methylomirabilis sp.]|nr:tetratricopeptide repeat protein [Deltaproteobacteria bacterium]
LLGEAARKAGRPKRAAEAYEAALALEPRDAESHCALAEIRSELGELARAAPEWRWCAELDEGRRAEAEAKAAALAPEDAEFGHASGYAFMMAVPQDLVSDGGDRGNDASRLALYENGERLGPAHQGHDHIAERGRGRYSHFEGALFFSTSDNSDPNLNGRRYAYKIEDGR